MSNKRARLDETGRQVRQLELELELARLRRQDQDAREEASSVAEPAAPVQDTSAPPASQPGTTSSTPAAASTATPAPSTTTSTTPAGPEPARGRGRGGGWEVPGGDPSPWTTGAYRPCSCVWHVIKSIVNIVMPMSRRVVIGRANRFYHMPQSQLPSF